MKKSGAITQKQFLFSVFCFLLSSPFFIAILFKRAKHESWIIMLLGGIIGFAISYMVMTLYNMNKGRELVGICRAAVGKTAGSIIAALYLIFFLIKICINTAQFSGFLSSNVLPNTPVAIIIVTFLLACTLSAKRGAVNICGFAFWFVLPIIIYTLTSTVLLSGQFKLSNFFPMLSLDSGSYLKAALTVVAEPFANLAIFLMLFNESEDNGNLRKYVLIGYTMSVFLLLIAVLRESAIFGDFSQYLSSLLFQSARLINMGEVLSRVEIIYVLLLLIITFFKVGLSIYAASKLFASITGCGAGNLYVFPIGIIACGITPILFPSYVHMNEWGLVYAPFYTWIFEIIIPLFLLIICAVKKLSGSDKFKSDTSKKTENINDPNAKKCFAWTMAICCTVTAVIAVLRLAGVKIPMPLKPAAWLADFFYKLF